MDCKCIELVTTGRRTGIKNITYGDLEISLVMIQLGVTRLKKTKFMYLLDLFGEMGEKGWHDLVCVECL